MSDSLEHEIRTLRAHFWSDRDPDGRAFAPLAEAYLTRGDLEEALALVQDGLGRLPDYATGFLVAARVHRARGDGAAARHAVETLLSLDGASAPGLRLLGEMAEEAGETEIALSAFREALSRDPGYADLEGRIARLDGPDSPPAPEATPETEVAPAPEAIPEAEAEAVTEKGPAGNPEWASEPVPEGVGGELEGFESFEPFHLPESDLSESDLSESDLLELDVPESGAPERGVPDVDAPESPVPDLDLPEEVVLEEGGEPLPRGSSPPLVTRTMADLYLRQGFRDRGVELYRQLAELHPGDEELRSRLTELETAPAQDDGLGETEGASLGPSADAFPHDPPQTGGPTAGRYLRDLLAWEPGAVPIASLAPDAEPEPPGEEPDGALGAPAPEGE